MSNESTTISGQNDDDWIKGVALAITAAVVSGVSKLLIRKSWLLEVGDDPRSTTLKGDGGENNGGDDVANDLAAATLSTDEISHERLPSDGGPSSPVSYGKIDTSAAAALSSSLGRRRRRRLPLLLRACGVFGVSVLQPVFGLSAISFAPPSLLVPFAGLSLVTVVILDGPVSGEWPSAGRVGASAAVVAGGLIVALYGDRHGREDVDEILRDWRRGAGTIAVEIVSALWLWFLAVVAIRSKDFRWRRAAWGISCGTVLGWNAIVTKDTVTVLQSVKSLGFWNWPPVLFQLGAVSILLFLVGILLLVFSMRWFDATSLASLIVGSVIFSTSVVSAVHYNTFAHLTRTDAVCYLVGLALVLTGLCFMNVTSVTVVVPTAGQKERDGENEESAGEVT